VLAHIEWFKEGFGVLLGIVGVAILEGMDKWMEAQLISLLPESWIQLIVKFVRRSAGTLRSFGVCRQRQHMWRVATLSERIVFNIIIYGNKVPFPHFSLDQYTLHQHLPINDRGKDWFVGDIHGYGDRLLKTLSQRGFDFEKDRLFAVGDLIDRGPHSLETVRLFLDAPWAYSTLGNHEWIMIRALEGDAKMEALERNPICGSEWRNSLPREQLIALANEIRQAFPIALTVDVPGGRIGVVHAAPPPRWSWLATSQVNEWIRDHWTNLLWSRDAVKQVINGESIICEDIDAVVCGHSTLSEIAWQGNVIFIDTLVSWSGESSLTLTNAESLLAMAQNTHPAMPGKAKWLHRNAENK